MTTVLPCAGVLFDCDGVLVDSAATISGSWTRWAEQMQVDPAAVIAAVHGRRSVDTAALFIDAVGLEVAIALIDAIEIEDAANLTAIPGAAALLAAIPQERWAIVTSGSVPLASARLAAAGIALPPVMVTADDVAHGKPHPEGYLAGARLLGLPAQQCVVVEDAPAGVRAARAAGVGYVLGVGDHDFGEDRPDVTVPDLRHVRWTGAGLEIRQF
ncbi:MAG: HAD-IA family hydrolase [Thermomicrobiales bacterium]